MFYISSRIHRWLLISAGRNSCGSLYCNGFEEASDWRLQCILMPLMLLPQQMTADRIALSETDLGPDSPVGTSVDIYAPLLKCFPFTHILSCLPSDTPTCVCPEWRRSKQTGMFHSKKEADRDVICDSLFQITDQSLLNTCECYWNKWKIYITAQIWTGCLNSEHDLILQPVKRFFKNGGPSENHKGVPTVQPQTN